MSCKSTLAKVIILGAGMIFGWKAFIGESLVSGCHPQWYIGVKESINLRSLLRVADHSLIGDDWGARSAKPQFVFSSENLAPRWVKPHATGACMDLTLES